MYFVLLVLMEKRDNDNDNDNDDDKKSFGVRAITIKDQNAPVPTPCFP